MNKSLYSRTLSWMFYNLGSSGKRQRFWCQNWNVIHMKSKPWKIDLIKLTLKLPTWKANWTTKSTIWKIASVVGGESFKNKFIFCWNNLRSMNKFLNSWNNLYETKYLEVCTSMHGSMEHLFVNSLRVLILKTN